MVKMEAEIMDDQKYVTRLMRARCSKGTMENYLNVDLDHGIVVGADMQPLMNANDHVSGRHVIHFGCCESDQNPERMFRKGLVGGLLGGGIADALEDVGIMTCKCKPNTPNPWEFVNEDNIVEGAPALMVCSKLTCRYGGIIEIIDPDGNEDAIDIDDNTEDDGKENVDHHILDALEEQLPTIEREIKRKMEFWPALGSEVSKEISASLPDGTTMTYSLKVALKSGNADWLTIKGELTNQAIALEGHGWSIDSDGKIELGGNPILNYSIEDLEVGVKLGQDSKINDYTTLHAPIYSIRFNKNKQLAMAVETGADTDTQNFEAETSLKLEKPIDDNRQPQFEPVTIPAQEPEIVMVPETRPWYEAGWDWVCETADNAWDWASDNAEAIGLTGATATVAIVTYFVISEGSRIFFPVRNLVPVP